MIEEDPGNSEQPVLLGVIAHHGVRQQFGRAVRVARIERRILVLRFADRRPEHFGGGSLVKAHLRAFLAQRFQQTDHAHPGQVGHFSRILPGCEGHRRSRQVVNLIRLRQPDALEIAIGVRQVANDQFNPVMKRAQIVE